MLEKDRTKSYIRYGSQRHVSIIFLFNNFSYLLQDLLNSKVFNKKLNNQIKSKLSTQKNDQYHNFITLAENV